MKELQIKQALLPCDNCESAACAEAERTPVSAAVGEKSIFLCAHWRNGKSQADSRGRSVCLQHFLGAGAQRIRPEKQLAPLCHDSMRERERERRTLKKKNEGPSLSGAALGY